MRCRGVYKIANLVVFAVVFTAAPQPVAAQVIKCVADGKTTYQNTPCSTGQQPARPTVEQLNRERQEQRKVLSGSPQPVAPTVSTAPANTSPLSGLPVPALPRCDGRKHCSQMTSCAEAQYFLANCPGVKMDGDRDGIACEEQWCQ